VTDLQNLFLGLVDPFDQTIFGYRQAACVDLSDEHPADHLDMLEKREHGPETFFQVLFLGLKQGFDRKAVPDTAAELQVSRLSLNAQHPGAGGVPDQGGLKFRPWTWHGIPQVA